VKRSTCRSCSAPIIWAETDAGKRIPVDADPAPDGSLDLTEFRPGEVHAGFVPEDQRAGLSLHRSHFSTCPDARAWRKPR
jgi:hypothetical protein